MKSAHLVVWLTMTKKSPLPVVTSAGIYSSGATQLTASPQGLPAELFSAQGETYEEASKTVIESVKRMPWLSWALPWIEGSFESWQVMSTQQAQITQIFFLPE